MSAGSNVEGNMIDFHSHVLPSIDDGSQSVQESLQLLAAQGSQGCHTVVATPHFYADRETVGEFLQRRAESYGTLAEATQDGLPTVRLGAEVAYYPGISRSDSLTDLRVEGSHVLLLEMLPSVWGEYTVNEVLALSCSGELTVVLAHVERYLYRQPKSVKQRFLENGVLFQANASFFLERGTRRKALKRLKEEELHLLGSDCHNLRARPPRIGEAAAVIGKVLGAPCLERMDRLGRNLLAGR